jgi:hypothetical protein
MQLIHVLNKLQLSVELLRTPHTTWHTVLMFHHDGANSARQQAFKNEYMNVLLVIHQDLFGERKIRGPGSN